MMNADLDAAVKPLREWFEDWTTPSREIVNRLLEGLFADKRTAEMHASYVHRLGPVTEDVIPALIRALDFEERSTSAIRSTLVAFGPPALRQLIADFNDWKANPEDSLRGVLLVQAIAAFGGAAREIVPDLVLLLDHRRLHVRVPAAIALWRIDGRAEGRASMIVQGLFLPNVWEVVDWATVALCEMGTEAQEAIPALMGALAMTSEQRDLDAWLCRRAAIAVLENLGSLAAPAIPALEAAQSDADQEIRTRAKAAAESIRRQSALATLDG